MLWLVIAYPASMGPLSFVTGAGWLTQPPHVVDSFYRPMIFSRDFRLDGGLIDAYQDWCLEAGKHFGSR
jgi:hypothetical protein